MKRIIISLILSVSVLGLGWVFLPHSLFSVSLETPTQPPAPVTGQTQAPADLSIVPTAPNSAPTLPVLLAGPNDISVSHNNISFMIPAGLASGATGEVVTAQGTSLDSNGAATSPAYTRFVLQAYPVIAPAPMDYYKAEVRVYPVAEYTQVNSWAATVLQRLQDVLANPTAPLKNATLPYPVYRGQTAQLYAAQARLLPFQNGTGVRMISSYAQFPAPVGKLESIYHYEGLTRDGKYFVQVDLPIILPVYADETNPGEYGITYQRQDWSLMDPYYQAVTDLLDSASPTGFNPMLTQLDALVQSINIGEATAPAASACPTPVTGLKLLTNRVTGFCVLYPESYSTTMQNIIVINPTNAPGDMPGDAWVLIQSEDALGRSALNVATERMSQFGEGYNITSFSVPLDNEQAVVVEGLPGQDSTRMVFVVHANRLYTFSFAPWYPAAPGAAERTPLENLYTQVIQSFHFLSPTTDAVTLTPDPQTPLWQTYHNVAGGFSFEYPAVYDDPANEATCGLYESPESIHFGHQIEVTLQDIAGLTLDDFTQNLVQNKGWTVDTQQHDPINGLEALTLQYRFGGTNRFGTLTLIQHAGSVLSLNMTAGSFCEIPGNPLTEPEAYTHLVQSLRFDQ